jgi:hypothetical protein
MLSSLCLFLLASALAPAVQATTAVEATSTVNVLVTDRLGKPLPSARVVVNGESEREGKTNNAGRIVFTNMKAGDYMLRVERDKFITFEKEFAVYGQWQWTPVVVAAISPVSSLAVRPSKAPASARPAVPASSRSGQTPVSLVGER